MRQRKRLLIISGNTFSRDDVWASHTAALWQEFALTFEEVHIFARSDRQAFTTMSQGPIFVHLVPRGPRPMASFLASGWLVLWVMLRFPPYVIQAQSAVHGGLAAAIYGRIFHTPVLVEIHGEHYLRDRPKGRIAHYYFYRPLASLAFRMATAVRSLSDEMTESIGEVFGPSILKKVVCIPNRVDLDIFSPPKDDYSFGAVVSIITVGSLVPNKNHVALVRELASSNADVRLTIVGSGPEDSAIRSCAAEVGVTVDITGTLAPRRVADALRRADIYVHFSRSEAVPRAVLEAMGMGLPVIVTDVGFLRGIVDHGVTGLRLGSHSDCLTLGDAFAALGDIDRRESLGRCARQRVTEHHEWRSTFERHSEVLLHLRESTAS